MEYSGFNQHKEIQGMNFYQIDCMDLLRQTPDKYYDLCICDPPYGIGISSNPFRQKLDKKSWDNSVPSDLYFEELFRVSKNQIVWGGNYFNLPASQGFIVWDKIQPEDFSSSMCEFGWMSFQSPAKIFRLHVVTAEKNKIHPTQKPVALYSWLLANYAKPGMKILDTHLGSGSIAIACYNHKMSLVGCELDKDYFDAAMSRIERETAQMLMI